MIDKNSFCKLLSSIEKQRKLDAKKADCLSQIAMGSFVSFWTPMVDDVVELLDEIVGDKWVSWWLYDDATRTVEVDGVKIDVKTPARLYDFIYSQKNKATNGR